MTYDGARAYLDTFVNYEHTPKPTAMRQMTLDRMRQLCQRLGDPQRTFRSVLVGGTNGKGSICAMLYSMLRQTPLRVGLYVSPHLEDLRERIRVWGPGRPAGEPTHADDWIEPAAFAALVERLAPHLDTMRKQGLEESPTYFEAITALAFLQSVAATSPHSKKSNFLNKKTAQRKLLIIRYSDPHLSPSRAIPRSYRTPVCQCVLSTTG